MTSACKHCVMAESEHHDFERQMPRGCVCDPNEWGDDVPSPCYEYQGYGKRCHRCEHAEQCHGGAHDIAESELTAMREAK